MLRIRIITALIIFLTTLAVVFLTPPWLFRLLVALLLLTGCWEFRRLADLAPSSGWALLLMQTAILLLMLYFWPVVMPGVIYLLMAGCLCWLLMFIRLLQYKDGERPDGNFRKLGFLSALAAITFCWISLSWLRDRPDGEFIVFLLLLVIWASDVGAYFSGRQFGRRKLAPVISPNKTWEGVYGGIVLALAAVFLFANYIAGLSLPIAALVIMTIVTTLTSVGGDLFISIHKRAVQLKDTGRIFPGHGGVLDRYDSLLAGAPFFALAFGIFAQ